MTSASGERRVLLLVHPNRAVAADVATEFVSGLEGITPYILEDQRHLIPDGDLLSITDVAEVTPNGSGPANCPIELVVVFGGDGTILWGAELARAANVPLLGLNLGHVGFLAEAEQDEASEVAAAVARREYRVEERLTLDVVVSNADGVTFRSWALNEASIEKDNGTRMLDMLVSVNDDDLSQWGADGLVIATPTGSTAYAWSAGGPVVWPQVQALLVVPNSAHALFARPLVVTPDCTLCVNMSRGRPQRAHLWCDGRRHWELANGDTVTIRRNPQPVLLARLHPPAFVQRLVGKFNLPVAGWRRRSADEVPLGSSEKSSNDIVDTAAVGQVRSPTEREPG